MKKILIVLFIALLACSAVFASPKVEKKDKVEIAVVLKTIASEYWGYVKGQHFYKTWYNKKVKKGKEVKSYYIYNPKNNYCDDVVAVVDNKILQ